MGISKRGKTYYIDYYWHGKRIREAVGENKKLAEAALAKRKTLVVEGKFLDKRREEKITFDTLCRKYLEWSKTAKESWARDELSIKRLLKSFGGKVISDITPWLVEKFKRERLQEQNQNDKSKSISKATVNRELACLKGMLNKAVEWRLASDNPVKTIRLFKEENQRIRYLSKEEEERLVSCCHPSLLPLVLTALHTGMRKGELFSLRWEHVDLTNGYIHLEKTKNKKRRDIPMNSKVSSLFKSLPHYSEYVFPGKEGMRTDIKKAFSSALRKANISNFRFHDLRHTFASRLVMMGVDLLTVKELLGHSTLAMVQRYAHLSPDHKRRAVSVLEQDAVRESIIPFVSQNEAVKSL